MSHRHLQRGYTEADWLGAQEDPVLDERELGFVTDTGEHVLGDGVTAFSGLTRHGGSSTYLPSPPMRSGYYFSAGNSGTFSPSNGDLRLCPIYLPTAISIDRLWCNITSAGTAGALARLALYVVDEGAATATLVVDGGTADATSTGGKEVVVAESLAAGLYGIGVVTQGDPATPPTYTRAASATMQGFFVPQAGILSALSPAACGWRHGTGVTGAPPDPATLDASQIQTPLAGVRFA